VEGAGGPSDWTAFDDLRERFGGGGLGVPGEEKHEGRELGSDWQVLTHLQLFSSFSFPP
jgi:hypothetical protein